MDPIEQAILYVKDRRNPGAAVILAKTPGIRQTDEGELLGWAFDYEGDFSREDDPKAVTAFQDTDSTTPEFESHYYFHPLPSGCYALCHQNAFPNIEGDTTSLVSHCLVIPPRLLRAFHNDVLAIHKALMAREDFHFLAPDSPVDTSTLSLSPIIIGVRHTSVIDTGLLEAVREAQGAAGFGNLLSLSIHSVCSFFTWLTPPIPLIHSVIQCLPVALRPELTFATSLHFSSARPLRLIAVHENSRKAGDVCNRFAIPFFHIASLNTMMLRERLLSHRNWATFVYHILDRSAYDPFVRCMTDPLKSCSFETRGTADWNMLNQVGRTLLDLWDSDGIESIDDHWGKIFSRGNSAFGREALSSTNKSDKPVVTDENLRLRGDYSHERFQSEVGTTADRMVEAGSSRESVFKNMEQEDVSRKLHRLPRTGQPTRSGSDPTSQRRLALRFPQYEREIRQLDSLIARSLFGDAMALEALETAWGNLRKRLAFQEIEIIRENYVHLVQSIIVQPRDPDYPKPPRRTLDSLDVMNIFLQEK